MSARPVLLFFAVWLGITGLVVGALINPVLPGGWWTVGGFIVVGLAAGAVIIRGFSNEIYPSAIKRLLIYRPFWYVMLSMPFLAGASVFGVVTGYAFGESRLFGYWTIGVTAALIALFASVGFVGSKRLVVKTFEVRIRNFPRAFNALRIVQISDLHVGPHTSAGYLARIKSAVDRAHPDIIAITGDQVDDFALDVKLFVKAFQALRAPLGVFVIAGNHDVYAGWEAVYEGLTAMGMTVLVNDAVCLTRDGEQLWIAGTGDPAGRMWKSHDSRSVAPDIERTLAPVPENATVVALAHNPLLWDQLAERGASLTRSGHTHYGQFAIPMLGWNIASPFMKPSMGSHRHKDSLLYINPGTNYWGLPFRIGTPPEVSVLVLSRCEEREPGVHFVGKQTA